MDIIYTDLRPIVTRLAELYSLDERRLWLYSSNQLLDGAKAIDLIKNKQTGKVQDAIERLITHDFI